MPSNGIGGRSLDFGGLGAMEDPAAAYERFTRHYRKAEFARKGEGFAVLELGPGESLFSAPIARAFGAAAVNLVDIDDIANHDPALYRRMVEYLAGKGQPVIGLDGFDSVHTLLEACSARYLTRGKESLRLLPTASIDLIISDAVLPSIRREELLDTLKETRRVLRPDGACSHGVGLWDLRGEALDHLRIPATDWESDAMARSGGYTNRYRFSELLGLLGLAGFRVDVTEVMSWDHLPIPRETMQPAFRGFTEDDLRVYSFHVTLRPSGPAPSRPASP